MAFLRSRRIFLALGAAFAFTAAAWLGGLAVVPALFGHDVGAGFASVERSLCALGGTPPDIVIGGDSRAKQQVEPLILEEITGKRAINVAEAVTFGGDLPTLANALRKQPGVLAESPVLILSVSVPGFNDLALDDLPAAAVLNWAPRDHLRVAFRAPGKYAGYLFGWYLPFLKRHWAHRRKGTGFACEEGVALQPALMASRGFRPHHQQVDTLKPAGRFQTREDFLLDGGRRRAFAKALEYLAASPARAILLYNAPMTREWREDPAHAVDVEMEHRFADLVAAEAARHPKVRFVDFVRNPPEDLESEHFADNYHLNGKGSPRFTRRLAGLLRDLGWVEAMPSAGAAEEIP